MRAAAERLAEVVRERSHVRAAAHRDIEDDFGRVGEEELERVDLDGAVLALHLDPATRRLVEPLSPHFDRGIERRPLAERAAERAERIGDFLPSRKVGRAPHDRAGPILCVRGHAEMGPRVVALGQEAETPEDAGCPSFPDEEEPAREGIEGARVPYATLAEKGAHPSDHIVRGPAFRLIQ
jgi:hypothetical protein